MKKDEIFFNVGESAKKLGMSRDILLKELEDGKIKGNRRGQRIKFTQADIDEYKENQRIDKSIETESYAFKHLEV
ncbi:MAG: helix-turn-helix domain-containing protein [Candidatus Scalindua sp.]|jgi:excisionase family DNA binding protein|nr:helix-turn-helix domain-containing protein [Candidatus Scalindua sp.]MBT6052297.1 helix-turn-helix domain-containing protein [Candidatus Scalindua sp.]